MGLCGKQVGQLLPPWGFNPAELPRVDHVLLRPNST